MIKFKSIFILFFVLFLSHSFATAQNLIGGQVLSAANNEPLPAASVLIKSSSIGAYTDDNGKFKIKTTVAYPLSLSISIVGYQDTTINLKAPVENLKVLLRVKASVGQEVVVAASRIEERILESPVSIERLGTRAVKYAIPPNYYDAIANFKGVDMTASSINFKTISTRGFNGSGSLRVNQLVDDMNNQAPALNFSVGNLIGITELDADNVEVISGASSALYGSGGMNGTILMNSKNPFKYQGLSFQIKQGVNHVDNYQRKAAPYYDWSLRWGVKLSDKFAFKISTQYVQAQDWQAYDYSNLQRNNILSKVIPGTRQSDPNYDGVNVYGDEVSANMQYLARLGLAGNNITATHPLYTGFNGVANLGLTYAQSVQAINTTPSLAALVPYISTLFPTIFSINRGYYAQNISRTGYEEKYLTDYNAYNFKISGGVYYKIHKNIEASLIGYWGIGTTVYTGIDRYSIKNFSLGQYKLEVKDKNWFVRLYTTQENSGDSYASTITAIQMNSIWKTNTNWFGDYIKAYTSTMLQNGGDKYAANQAGRAAADVGRLLPGTTAYTTAMDQVINKPITNGGGKFADKSALYQFDAQYNFEKEIKFAEVLVGGSYRDYLLKSGGTIFADNNPLFNTGNINIAEWSMYAQVGKWLFNNKLKLTVSGRYDKNQNFKGRFTPRATAVVTVFKNNTVRLSYQSAYRFPSTQDQWINLNSPSAILLGALPIFNTVYKLNENPIYTAESIAAYRAQFALNGTIDATLLKRAYYQPINPEVVNSYELGYRSIINNKIYIDAYVYYSEYKDFLGKVAVGRGINNTAAELLSPSSTNNYSFSINSTSKVKTKGWGVSIDYSLPKNFTASANLSGDQLSNVEPELVTFFNTPKFRASVGLSNRQLIKKWGFGVSYRYQSKVDWEGTFGSGTIPAFGVFDGMITYKASPKSLIKLGASNILNKYYINAFGNPSMGGLYYISYTFNN